MTKRITIALLIAAFAITIACAFPLVGSSDEKDNMVAETVQAILQQSQVAATYTPLPTQTPLPTYTYYPDQPHPPAATAKPCNQASFISETVEDNTEFTVNEEFTKSWRLKNTGTCTWNPNYELVFSSGDRMSGPKSQDLDTYVEPGEYVDIVIDLEAPDESGTYKGYWKLQSDDGEKFYQVYAQIIVEDFFSVTGVTLDATPDSYTGACPDTITVAMEAEVSTSAAGKVTYRWIGSNGADSGLQSVKFTSAGTKTVTYDWSVDVAIDETLTIEFYVDNPNHQTFGPLSFVVDCP